MAMFDEPPRYRTFVITLWEERSENPDVGAVWRFRVEEPRTHRQHGFVSFEELVTFLETQVVGSGGEAADE